MPAKDMLVWFGRGLLAVLFIMAVAYLQGCSTGQAVDAVERYQNFKAIYCAALPEERRVLLRHYVQSQVENPDVREQLYLDCPGDN